MVTIDTSGRLQVKLTEPIMNMNVGKVLSVEDLFERNHSGTHFRQCEKSSSGL